MLAISNFTWSIAMIFRASGSRASAADMVFEGGGRRRALSVVRVANARSMRLTIDPRDASVRLALPPRASLPKALGWVAGKRLWVEAELARLPEAQPIVPDITFLLGGDPVTLDWSPAASRVPRRDGAVLRIGGSLDGLDARLLRYLRREALRVLSDETRALATAHDISVGRIGVGDPKSRWGSCAASGDIRYSWRLILAPSFVRLSTVAHEVAHRVHMNHSPAFHALAADLFGEDPTPARRWLRAHGTALHWFGRDG
jgi:predicted metal-dependent hydrolase